MKYYLYEIRNNLNGKIYVGVHKTRNEDDGYMGSGKVIKSAIDKYGIDNFTKTILEWFDNSAAMYAREKEVVNEEFLKRDDVYNLMRGGFGGFDYLNSTGLNNNKTFEVLQRAGFSTQRKMSAEAKRLRDASLSERSKKRHADGLVRYDTFIGKTHTEESKKKIGMKNSYHQAGEKNSQFGKCWITDGVENKKIDKTDTIPTGWKFGRILKQGREQAASI